jgi:hypothetical protein
MIDMAYCGLMCDGCPIYLASREENEEKKRRMRVEIALKCNDLYQSQYGPEDVTDCDGCKAESGRLFSGCRKCEIRACAVNRKIENCGRCGDYPCDPLKKMFRTDPETKTRLDGLR